MEERETMERIGNTRPNRRQQYEACLRENPPMYQAAKKLAVPPGDAVALVDSYVLAPALGGFVRWVLQQAVQSGKQRIYFLARDGYFPYRAAQFFCAQMGLPIECRYLSCSRYSLRIPMFHFNREEALGLLCRRGMDVNLERVLSRGGLTRPEREAVEKELALPFSPKTLLTPDWLAEIQKRLGRCKPFLAYLDRHSREALPAAAGYFQQEGLMEQTEDAIVDSGWVGSIQQTLGELLRRLGRTKKLEGYYWGLYDLPRQAGREEYHSYYFGPEGNLKEKIWFNNSLFEAVYTAPHGMTLGYEETGGRYLPIYGDVGQGRKEFARRLESYLTPYLKHLMGGIGKDLFLYGGVEQDLTAIRRLFRLFMGTPTPGEAEAFGSLPFSDDVVEGGDRQIAALLTEEQLRDHHILSRWMIHKGLRKNQFRESAWYTGSAVRGGRHIPRHLRQYALYQFLRHARTVRRFQKERRKEG